MSSLNRRRRLCARALTLVLTLLTIFTLAAQLQFGALPHAAAQTTPPADGTVFALTANNTLLAFNPLTPGTLTRTVTITGLPSGAALHGIDFRPANNQLYAVSSGNRLYIINSATGAATALGTAALSPALSGTAFGMDFNPGPDRIRLVSDADQNLRLQPDTGAVAATDTTLAYAQGDANAGANPNIAGAGYKFTGKNKQV